jgi:hypothetical protein
MFSLQVAARHRNTLSRLSEKHFLGKLELPVIPNRIPKLTCRMLKNQIRDMRHLHFRHALRMRILWVWSVCSPVHFFYGFANFMRIDRITK